ncbi:MAG: glycosyltransferase family 2 protein [Phycisphaeraceae bacterium]|nr:glycosyltransferase family 2 protein [Phycisphaeraceae bacterium]
MPCLNEARTLGGCVQAAQACIDSHSLNAEIIVADNGSTDGSQQIARSLGARVVDVPARGYGAALMGGIEAARGEFIIMGDADQSYDFGQGMAFVQRLREGHDLVMGSRLPRGGGSIEPGAMPWKNRWIGNPTLTTIGRILFRTPVTDFHCGLRAFRKASYQQLGVRTTGMEFASELAIKASLRGQRICEVPITLHKDGRDRPPHLRPWRDGWRHLRFMLLLAPLWTLIAPGLALMLAGCVLGAIVSLGPVTAAGVTFDVHTLLAASLMVIVGYQALTIGIAARIFAMREEIGPPSPVMLRLFSHLTLELGLIVGALVAAAGVGLIGWLVARWGLAGFGNLDVGRTLRPMIVGATLTAIGVQTVLMSFFYSMLGIQNRRAG